MNKNIGKGLTYDDVLLIPQKSSIASRKEVDTQTFITKNIPLQIPFVSSNVDTVTESHMAIEMAKLGCIGFIHRFMTIPKQVKEVDSVKRSEGFIMGNPLVLGPSTKLMDARSKMKAAQVSSVIVVDRENKVLGLVSDRDTWFEDNENIILEKLMTPFDKLITAPLHISWKEARVLFKKYKIEKLPIIAKDKKLLGLITSRTVLNVEKYPLATKDKQGRLRVGAAIGVVGDYFERAHELVKVGVDILVVDIAHAHSIHGLNAIKKVRKAFPKVEIVGGNIATYEGAKDMIRLGCDALKVGIGPGGICITRMVAGAGVPQLTAIMEVCKATHRAKIPVIADGGTNFPGDMSKALAAGASTVMLTGWLAGTNESPGAYILRKGQKYKIHRGAASFSAVADRKITAVSGQVRKELSEFELQQELASIVPEGVETFVPYKGAAKEVIYQLHGALKSGMSYCNAKNIKQLWQNSQFIEISDAGLRESKAHNVEEM